MKYGLIGETLGHSFSKEIHEQLANYTYDLLPLDQDAFHTFMKAKNFQAINVTIPYKKAVIPYLDELDAKAKSVGAVNTIVQRNGTLYGYNTDYDGFLYTLRKHHIEVSHKKVLVLGDGGAAQAIKAVLVDEQAKTILSVRRQVSADTYTLDEVIAHHQDVEIIVNTTPCGMYPNIDEIPCNLHDFPNCQAVIDIIYNPLHTKLSAQAKQLGIPAIGGLEMLIAQAKVAVTHFVDKQILDDRIDEIYRNLLQQKTNIVLIGMPSCGKTTIGKALSDMLQKEFIDVDEAITQAQGRSIREIIEQDGEPHFRKLEHDMVKQLCVKQNYVIATGGGVIKNSDNMLYLQMNGIVLYIHRDLHALLVDKERPLSSSMEAIQALYEERLPLYQRYADATIVNDQEIDHATAQALQVYNKELMKL